MTEGKLRKVKPIVILLKCNNQESIAFAHNCIIYWRKEYVDIQHNYIQDKIAIKIIELSCISIDEIITDVLIKVLTYDMFHWFIKQMRIT